MSIERFHSDAPWEKQVGYCRVVKAGQHVYVTGTAPINPDGTTYAPGDAYAQARRCFELIRENLVRIDVPMNAIVRTRMFVTNIDLWADFGRAHKECFADFPPATTMVEVQRLIDPQMLIEVEADAFLLP